MVGSFAHAGILLVRDYYTQNSPVRPIYRILDSKSPLISHLSFVSLWLGFHTTGVYVHNDTVSAFGEAEKQILIEPVFSQIISDASSRLLFDLSTGASDYFYFGTPVLTPGDFTAHHAIALGLHLTTLILLKGSLDARGSRLMPDKIHMAWAFACDGPHRGGTCDISAWDSVYLATFWSLNTGAWIGFYFHWKHLALWQNSLFQFDESSSYLNAWFSNYLWFNSSPLIRAYDALHANDLSVWAWTFLAAHLCWATGFMFLISWRGYWQELIDICLYMHLKTPIGYAGFMLDIYTPVALSIVQARALGLFHFGCGTILTYAAFIIGATS
jgi:photosystem I P700 chlorophyll a apoprotein A2